MFGDAEAYDRFMGRWSRLLAPPFLAFANLPEHGRVLDIGSGTGSLAAAIAERNGHVRVLGIDSSQQYVTQAASRSPFPDRTSFEVGDTQQLRYPDASFDASLSLLVFNFIPDSRKALSELRRVTRPDSTIAAAVWDYGDGMRMLRTFWDAAVHRDSEAEKLDEKHMRLSRPGELSALWRAAGLENVQEQAIEIGMEFKSFADYWNPFLLGQGPAGAYVGRLDREKVEILRNEVKHRLAISEEESPFVLLARAWAVRGVNPGRRWTQDGNRP